MPQSAFRDGQDYIEEIWTQLEEVIVLAAEMTLPKMKITRKKLTDPKIRFADNSLIINLLYLTRIRRLLRKIDKNPKRTGPRDTLTQLLYHWNTSNPGFEIPLVKDNETKMENILREVDEKWQGMRISLTEDLVDITRAEIKETINRRHKLLKLNPTKMINNVLTRWSESIILD